VNPESAASGQPLAAARRAVAAAFEAGGDLAAVIAGFVPRTSQREMALRIFDSIVERGTFVAEAGTGTGKTFAYLVPALRAGGKVLISTGTKALQDQIFRKDLAHVASALGLRVRSAILKGRQNYVCRLRLARTEAEGLLASRQDAAHLRTIVRFARTTETGDRSELAAVPESAMVWPAVTSTRENCIGQECPQIDECFVYKARRAAQAADVVVVNHHLFLADLALRDDSIAEFLPKADTVILDEAHQLPRIAADFFGVGWSLAQVGDLVRDARSIGLSKAADGARWVALTQSIEHAARELRLELAEQGLKPGARLALDRLADIGRFHVRVAAIDKELAALAEAVGGNAGRDDELDAIGPRIAALRHVIAPSWLDDDRSPSDEEEAAEFVRWVGLTAHGAQFQATPLAPGETFARLREQHPQAWILTSATLTVAGSFDAFLQDIGLVGAEAEGWESPFDFARQALLYLPAQMPSPLAPDFPEQVADAAWPVIRASGGRAFVLCTTLRAVDRIAGRLLVRMAEEDIDLPVLAQGSSTRIALLDGFRRAGNAVLVGSVSFWEGIDVRGDALSLVVIDKLPFAPPDDPVIEARIRRLRALGRNPFLEYQLPQAVTLLRQGAGRLIRDETDRGVLMILDERVFSKPYGRTVLASLPPFARTRDAEAASAFLVAGRSVQRVAEAAGR
jgi:ATP-dependent DNA helicase DinG